MRLTEKERTILYHAQLAADQPVPVLRKKSGYREHSIRYCLQQSSEQRLIEMRCFVDLCKLGFSLYEIFFSLSSQEAASRDAFLEALEMASCVTWIGELGGDYQYGINMCARSVCDVSEFLDELSNRFGAVFLEKSIVVRLSLTYYGNKYFLPKSFSEKLPEKTSKRKSSQRLEGFTYRATRERIPIDEIDHKILSGLTSYSYRSRRELSRHLSLPLSTLEYRIKKLEEQGVIVGFYYQVDPQKVGMQSFLLLVCLKGIDRELKDRFLKFCSFHPYVVLTIHCLGNWDFELVVDVEASTNIIGITQELRDELGGALQSIKVLPMFRYRKVSEYPLRELPAF